MTTKPIDLLDIKGTWNFSQASVKVRFLWIPHLQPETYLLHFLESLSRNIHEQAVEDEIKGIILHDYN